MHGSRTTRFLGALAAVGTVAAAGAVLLIAGAGPSDAAAGCANGYVGLTYDDGPNASTTTALLSALQTSGVRATFFNIGQNAQNNPTLVQAEKAAGMWIGNHTWDHDNVSDKATAYIQSELQRTQDVIQQLTGAAPKLFRPPYGSTSAALKAVEQQYGLTEVLWDVDTQDWNNATTDAIVQAAGTLTNGQVILMHDGFPNTISAVPRIVADLAGRGLCAGMISTTTGRAVAPDGGSGPTTPPSSPSPSPSSPTVSPAASTPAGSGGCSAVYTRTGEWGGGFQGDVKVTNTGASTTTAWTVTLTFANGQRITQVWNARTGSSASPYAVTNESYNNAVPAGGSTSFGLLGSWSGTNANPAVSCTRTP